MGTYHIIHRHTPENCYGPPNENDALMDLWRQVKVNAIENNVDIKYFKANPTEHIFFILLETSDYSNNEKTIGQCKKTGEFTITPVMEPPFWED